MNGAYKNLIIAILLIVLGLLVFKACNNHAEQPSTTSNGKALVIPKQITKQRVSAGGTVHTEVKVVEAAQDVWLDQYYQNLLQSVRDSLQLSQAHLREVLAASLTTNGSIQTSVKRDTVRLIDSSYKPIQIFTYHDKFINLAGRIENDSIDIAYKTFDSLTFVTYYKKSKLFAKKQLYMDAWPLNPNASIKGLQSIKVNAPQPKKWAIGIIAGYYFNGQVMAPGVGIGITKTIIRW